jgi:hyperosmotically inducible periplasmic protein
MKHLYANVPKLVPAENVVRLPPRVRFRTDRAHGLIDTAGQPRPHLLCCALPLIVRSMADLYFGTMNEPGKGSQMKTTMNLKLLGISMLLVGGLAACDKPGPAETAGKKIDQTASDAGKSIADATEKVGDRISAQSAKTGVAIDDAEITAKVKAAIFAEPGLKTLQIGVDTVKGVVTLTGSVDSLSSSERVKSMASAVSGVHDVENQLVIKPAN